MSDLSFTEISGRDVDGDIDIFLRERVTSGFPTITTDHAFIHEGKSYQASGIAAVGAGASYYVAFITASPTYVHWKAGGITTTGGPLLVTLYELVTASATSGTAVNPKNNYRVGTPAASTTSVRASCVVTTTTATPLISAYSPTSTTNQSRIGGEIGAAAEEWVLKRGTSYALKFKPTIAATIHWSAWWYEESGA